MTDEPRPTTILFADLAGSTGLYERLGDTAAHAVVSEALARWSEIITQNGGRVVKALGDGLFAVLPGPDDAVRAAEALHRSLDEGAARREVTLVGRMALHAGPVLERDGDVFGDAVNVASRLATLAKPRQILTSGEMAQLLDPATRDRLRSLGRTRVKGRAAELELHEWVWEASMVTEVVRIEAPADTAATLVVTAPNTACSVNAERSRITIGRQPFNDLVVDDTRVSRLHARIEMRGTRFVLCDESSNGTHLMPIGSKSSVLHGEERDLGAMGFIGLGAAPCPGEPHTVEYRIESPRDDDSAGAS